MCSQKMQIFKTILLQINFAISHFSLCEIVKTRLQDIKSCIEKAIDLIAPRNQYSKD